MANYLTFVVPYDRSPYLGVKYLGVIIDNKLNWKQHIQYLCSKLSSGSWALLKLRAYVNTSVLKTVTTALSIPIYSTA